MFGLRFADGPQGFDFDDRLAAAPARPLPVLTRNGSGAQDAAAHIAVGAGRNHLQLGGDLINSEAQSIAEEPNLLLEELTGEP